jgi:hypothetical protein
MRCRQATDTTNPHIKKLQVKGKTKYQLAGTCAACGAKKSKFVSKQHGEGLLSGLLGFKDGFPGLNRIPIIGQLL